jgi:hypothetical protein
MVSSGLKGLLIRTGVLRRPDLGFLLAGEPAKEEAEIPHVAILKWKAGQITRVDAKFNAHTSCILEDPEYGVVRMSSSGGYSIETRGGVTSGNVFKDSYPGLQAERFGDIRSVASIAGKAYAVGGTGWAFRLDRIGGWTLIDKGLPTTFNIESIDGFSESDLYAVGYRGEVWRSDGGTWSRCESPTNVNLNTVLCGGDGVVYAAGSGGMMIRGRNSVWESMNHDDMNDDIWDLAWFGGSVYASTLAAVYRLNGGDLVAVSFEPDKPRSCYHLSVASGTMWSIGARDVMSFDGSRWTRII